MKPINSEQLRRLIQDPWNHSEIVQQDQHTLHALDKKELKKFQAVKDVACGCGCLKPPGGFCGVCQISVCVDCFGHCSRCGKPLCRKHTDILEQAKVCSNCKDDSSRKRLVRGIIKIVLWPFVEFKDQ